MLGALLWCVVVMVPLCAAEPLPERTDLATLQAKVRELDGALDHVADPAAATALGDSLPYLVTVAAPTGEEYQLSFVWLKSSLTSLADEDQQDRESEIKAAHLRLAELEQQLAEYAAPPDAAGARSGLQTILNRREFSNVRGQPWTERLREEVMRWVVRLLEKIAPRLVSVPGLGRIVVLITVVIAVLLLGWWISRLISRAPRQDAFFLQSDGRFPSAKSWRTWLSEANAAAAAGQWRDAIHLCYWAAISNLESAGEWRPDRARTPREYLALLSPQSNHQAPLQEMTKRFELAWYAQSPVSEEEFRMILATAERMGCR
jgi:hypothetical protein